MLHKNARTENAPQNQHLGKPGDGKFTWINSGLRRLTINTRTVVSLVMFVMLISMVNSPSGVKASTPVLEIDQAEIVCKIPVGDQGIHYEGEGIPEALVWGPPAFTVAPDGSFWIADTVANRILHYSAQCEYLADLSLEGYAVGISDLEATDSSVWALDLAAFTPTVILITDKGESLNRYEIPADLSEGLSGISLGENGKVLVELFGGADVSQLIDSGGNVAIETQPGYSQNGKVYQAHPADLTTADANHGYIQVGETRLEVNTINLLGGLRWLGFGSQDSFYVIAEEVALVDGVIRVDQTVRQYDNLGVLVGLARIPLAEQYTYVEHGLAVGPDGLVYALLTRADGVEIQRLAFSPELAPILSADQTGEQSLDTQENTPQAPSSISPQTIIDNARAFYNNGKYLSSTNTDGTCSGRGKPRYLGGAGTYYSVSYDWGGFDTVGGFNWYMDHSYQAGDINTSAVESCSRGVDCSGFVSRAWGLSTKYSTQTLPNVSWQLSSVGVLNRGDILNNYSSHVVLFANFAPNGVNDYEATTYNSYDRVVYMYSSWGRMTNYLPRRFNEVTGDSCSGQYRAEYYNNRYLSGKPTFSRCENWPISYDWGSGGPGSGVGNDNFSARWVGRPSFTAGSYTFIARADDGIRVWLDQNLIINAWVDQGPTEYRYTAYVSAGYHNLQVDYYENGGGAVAQFRYETQGSSGNLALNKPAYAWSYQSSGYEPYRGNDGSMSTRWSSRIDSALGDQWWWVDLGSTQTINNVVIRWEAAYAAYYFVGWSNDAATFYGYWHSISAPGAYTYSLGTQNARYVGILMRTRAPNMNNYSFWEAEVYRNTGLSSDAGGVQEVQPAGDLEIMLLEQPQQIYLPLLQR